MSKPTIEKGLFPRKAYRILALLLLTAIIAIVAIFFAIKGEQKKLAGLNNKNTRAAQERAKIYSSQWVNKNAPSGIEPLSTKDSAALKAYEAAYTADSANRALQAAEASKVADSLEKLNSLSSEKSAEAAVPAESTGGTATPPTLNKPSNNCKTDTVIPVVYPDSTGGLHVGPAHVFLQTNKPCTVFWRFEPDTSWRVWHADTFVIDCTATLAYKAMDSCGRASESRQEHYEIKPPGFVQSTPALPHINCAADTLMPWAYLDPAGGLHYGPTHVCFQTNKPCTVYWRTDRDTVWQTWHSDTLLFDSTTTLAYKAIDSCGHTMEPQMVSYVIRPPRSTFPCAAGMEPVEAGSKQFCIDRYEWPNRKGALPLSYVSLSQAMDSCNAVGKRLCTSDEWSLACAGPDSFSYPYGRSYSRHACVTHDTTIRRSGSHPECRAFFGAYDMSGNLAEWTSTPAIRNARFYNVMGGFWESGPASGCYDARYSYFPQNRHNPVGFRCCKDFASSGK